MLAVLSNAIPCSNNERFERLAGATRKDRKLAYDDVRENERL
jgi:hypothetical protein